MSLEWRQHDQRGAGSLNGLATKDAAARRGRTECGADLPSLRDFSEIVLQVEAAIRRARPPHRSPRAIAGDVVNKILYLRQSYHFGAGRITDYLRRFHQVAVVRSSVHRILTRHGMQRLPANQKHQPHRKRWQRYEKPQPGHRLQMDVKFLERIPGTQKRLYQFTAIDDCTRIRVLKVYDRCNQRTAIRSSRTCDGGSRFVSGSPDG
jgi:hypothetical protein